jgi:hypothetical protein
MMRVHQILAQGHVLGIFHIGHDNIVVLVHVDSIYFSLTGIGLGRHPGHVIIRTISF